MVVKRIYVALFCIVVLAVVLQGYRMGGLTLGSAVCGLSHSIEYMLRVVDVALGFMG